MDQKPKSNNWSALMGREEQLLSASIAETLRKATAAETKVSYVTQGIRKVSELDHDKELYEAEETLRFYLEKLYRDVGILAERLGLPLFADEVAKKFRSYTSNALIQMEHEPWDLGLQSAPLAQVRSYYTSLATMTDGRAVTGIDVFRTILQNTAAIIQSYNVCPTKEADVKKAIFDVLKFAFHDAIREIHIGQLLITYKPDLGVRSLMAAAEYKFASSEREVKVSLEGIYADMKGYSGHYEWRTFFAVIYTTKAIVHQQRLEEEFRGVKADMNWTPIIVVGPGERKKMLPKSTTAA
jgi:hypothetical protein